MPPARIRTLDPHAPSAEDEIAQVVRRMHLTLVEVLGEPRALALHDDASRRERVLWHLHPPPGRDGDVLLAEDTAGAIVGHALVRVEPVDDGGGGGVRDAGLFGTVWVDPPHRRAGVAGALLAAGEAWMVARGMTRAMTYTDADNAPLQRLFEAHGYARERVDADWVRMVRALPRAPGGSDGP